MATNVQRKNAPKEQERRRHQRVKVSLLGRYMLENRQEFPCQTIDMSPGGVAFFAPVPGQPGERVIAYLDQIGRIEGRIARLLENGFALTMNLPLMKREKIANQLTWLANRSALGLPEDRRHERIQPRHNRSTLKLPDGSEHMCKLIDVSMSGAALTADAKAPVGSAVVVGKTPARVVRAFDGGVAVEFSRMFTAEEFSADIRL